MRAASFLLGGAPFFCNRAGTVERPILNEARNKLKNKVDGMDVVYRIEQVAVARTGEHQHLPVEPVVILKIEVID